MAVRGRKRSTGIPVVPSYSGLRHSGRKAQPSSLTRNHAIRANHETHEIHERNRSESEHWDYFRSLKAEFIRARIPSDAFDFVCFVFFVVNPSEFVPGLVSIDSFAVGPIPRSLLRPGWSSCEFTLAATRTGKRRDHMTCVLLEYPEACLGVFTSVVRRERAPGVAAAPCW
jgi:hypothetical protein